MAFAWCEFPEFIPKPSLTWTLNKDKVACTPRRLALQSRIEEAYILPVHTSKLKLVFKLTDVTDSILRDSKVVC